MSNILHPAVHRTLLDHKITYEGMACDPNYADTATFNEHYGWAAEDGANTIIVASKTDPVQYAACVIRADTRLDVNKAVCRAMGVRKASFATADQTMALTGMQIGGVTAFGLPTDLPVYVDELVLQRPRVVMGGGNRTSKIILAPSELQKLQECTVLSIAKQTT